MAKKVTRDPIPQTDSIEELARFWDTHDITDYEDELEEVSEISFDEVQRVISISLSPSEVESIKSIAAARGIPSTELLRDWVLEKLEVNI